MNGVQDLVMAPPCRAESSDLLRLRRLANQTPRHAPGCVQLGTHLVHYTDALSLYMEYKDIFANTIYHFEALKDRPRIIDGGACVGMAALYFKSVYPEAEIVCFEPDEAACAALRQNVAENELTDIEIVQAGLAGESGRHAFLPDAADGGRIVASEEGATTIQTVRLSDYLENPVDFVKLNIEGQELNVLREVEASGRLGNVAELVLEYHGWAGGRQSLGAILDLLDRNGFRYLVHDFDAETCSASKPPFRLDKPRTWFCLVYARRTAGAQGRATGTRAGPRPVDWGGLRRTAPISRRFGVDRGQCIDRYYIESFLDWHREDVRGRVLEIGDAAYTRRFGDDRVTRSDVLHVSGDAAGVTLVGDLSTGAGIPADAFDCIILTQTLQHVFDVAAAIRHVRRALCRGGIVLATVPGISQISRYDMDRWGDYWRFTPLSIQRLFEGAFPPSGVDVTARGNVLAAVAFLEGVVVEELESSELDIDDPDYPMLITVRARKGDAPG
ncbi:MAG: FkbM family methyltransferase [Phycisphaerae bacterium]